MTEVKKERKKERTNKENAEIAITFFDPVSDCATVH